MADNQIIVIEEVKNVEVVTPGPQGPRGRTILNGQGSPANNIGLEGDFYYDTTTTMFYGPKLNDYNWNGVTPYALQQLPTEFSKEINWSIGQCVQDPENPKYWYVVLNHNLHFKPNLVVKNSAGDVLETGIDYNSNDTLTLRMSEPFAGTVYLS